jgi:hypothetical protein
MIKLGFEFSDRQAANLFNHHTHEQAVFTIYILLLEFRNIYANYRLFCYTDAKDAVFFYSTMINTSTQNLFISHGNQPSNLLRNCSCIQLGKC